MDSEAHHTSPADNPASAFAELRGEVSLLRRAIEGLTAERQNAPDYTPTLKAHSNRLAHIEGLLGAIAESPAMRLTPENLAGNIAKASETARTGDRDTILQASLALRNSIMSIDTVVERARTADRQWTWLCWTAVGSLLTGATGAVLLLHLIGSAALPQKQRCCSPSPCWLKSLSLDQRQLPEFQLPSMPSAY